MAFIHALFLGMIITSSPMLDLPTLFVVLVGDSLDFASSSHILWSHVSPVQRTP